MQALVAVLQRGRAAGRRTSLPSLVRRTTTLSEPSGRWTRDTWVGVSGKMGSRKANVREGWSGTGPLSAARRSVGRQGGQRVDGMKQWGRRTTPVAVWITEQRERRRGPWSRVFTGTFNTQTFTRTFRPRARLCGIPPSVLSGHLKVPGWCSTGDASERKSRWRR